MISHSNTVYSLDVGGMTHKLENIYYHPAVPGVVTNIFILLKPGLIFSFYRQASIYSSLVHPIILTSSQKYAFMKADKKVFKNKLIFSDSLTHNVYLQVIDFASFLYKLNLQML